MPQRPRHSGSGVLEHLRDRGFTGTVWMLTGFSQKAMIARALAAGATRWLVKSTMTPRELTNLINGWATETRTQSDAASRAENIRNRARNAILVADNTATYVAVNPAAARLLEVEPSRVVGRQVWDFTPGPQVPEAEELWQEFVRKGSASGPYRVVTATGKEVAVRFEAFANVSHGLHVSVLEPE